MHKVELPISTYFRLELFLTWYLFILLSLPLPYHYVLLIYIPSLKTRIQLCVAAEWLWDVLRKLRVIDDRVTAQQ